MIKKLLFRYIILLSTLSIAQEVQLSNSAQISVLTCGAGNESYSLYGHTAIRIKDYIKNIDVVYNYGTFDFDTPNFILKFVKGDLQYFVSTSSYTNFEYAYQYENRSVYEQSLNISLAKKQQLFDMLNKSLKSDERFYMYKFIDRNCTNMVVDKLNFVLNDSVIATKKPVEVTYREILFPYSENHFFEQLGINIIFGNKVDQKAERLFLPFELLDVLKNTKLDNKPLVSETKTLFEARPSKFVPSNFNSSYVVLFFLILIVVLNRKSINLIYYSLIGLIGLFLCLVGFYSFHEEVMWNYNALLFNPLFLFLTYYIIKGNKSRIILFGKIILALHLVYIVILLNKVHLNQLLPFIICNFILMGRMIVAIKKNTNQL